jgi:signal transduction histidine kinase
MDKAKAFEKLVGVVQELSLARDLAGVMAIVRRAARELTGADGATFVLRDNGLCFYAEENAISPLWKGKRFPMQTCISGWAMLNRQAAVIEDIYSDPRIPQDAYRPTFVKSLVMVPIREREPIGAIGNYWASRRAATPDEVEVLQALANSVSIAMENVGLLNELEKRVAERTAELAAANEELEAFSYSVSHDLRAPLRHITGFADILAGQADRLDEAGKDSLARILAAGEHMGQLIEDLLALSKVARGELRRESVSLSEIAKGIAVDLERSDRSRAVSFQIQDGLSARGDRGLLTIVLQNLIANAWKFTGKTPEARIEVGAERADGTDVFHVRDNGAGFESELAAKLFQRLHTRAEFDGTGIGLAIVRRAVARHGGRTWATGAVGRGASFHFTVPDPEREPSKAVERGGPHGLS